LKYVAPVPLYEPPPGFGVGVNMFKEVLDHGFTSQPGAEAGLVELIPVTTFRYTPAVVDGMLIETGPLKMTAASDC
jgi:hypothetical protein